MGVLESLLLPPTNHLRILDQCSRCTPDNILLERINTIKFGPIPVRAITHVQQENIVLVLAGSELYRFKMSGDEVNVSQIVFEGTMIEVCGGLYISLEELDQANPEIYSLSSLQYIRLTALQTLGR